MITLFDAAEDKLNQLDETLGNLEVDYVIIKDLRHLKKDAA